MSEQVREGEAEADQAEAVMSEAAGAIATAEGASEGEREMSEQVMSEAGAAYREALAALGLVAVTASASGNGRVHAAEAAEGLRPRTLCGRASGSATVRDGAAVDCGRCSAVVREREMSAEHAAYQAEAAEGTAETATAMLARVIAAAKAATAEREAARSRGRSRSAEREAERESVRVSVSDPDALAATILGLTRQVAAAWKVSEADAIASAGAAYVAACEAAAEAERDYLTVAEVWRVFTAVMQAERAAAKKVHGLIARPGTRSDRGAMSAADALGLVDTLGLAERVRVAERFSRGNIGGSEAVAVGLTREAEADRATRDERGRVVAIAPRASVRRSEAVSEGARAVSEAAYLAWSRGREAAERGAWREAWSAAADAIAADAAYVAPSVSDKASAVIIAAGIAALPAWREAVMRRRESGNGVSDATLTASASAHAAYVATVREAVTREAADQAADRVNVKGRTADALAALTRTADALAADSGREVTAADVMLRDYLPPIVRVRRSVNGAPREAYLAAARGLNISALARRVFTVAHGREASAGEREAVRRVVGLIGRETRRTARAGEAAALSLTRPEIPRGKRAAWCEGTAEAAAEREAEREASADAAWRDACEALREAEAADRVAWSAAEAAESVRGYWHARTLTAESAATVSKAAEAARSAEAWRVGLVDREAEAAAEREAWSAASHARRYPVRSAAEAADMLAAAERGREAAEVTAAEALRVMIGAEGGREAEAEPMRERVAEAVTAWRGACERGSAEREAEREAERVPEAVTAAEREASAVMLAAEAERDALAEAVAIACRDYRSAAAAVRAAAERERAADAAYVAAVKREAEAEALRAMLAARREAVAAALAEREA